MQKWLFKPHRRRITGLRWHCNCRYAYLCKKASLEKTISWFLGTVGVLAILWVLLIGPVDDTPLEQMPFYKQTMHRLDSFRALRHTAQSKVKVGWAKINITPRSSMPMAGYAPRYHFDSVHDSIYVRILSIDNGGVQCFIISADLLIFPPALRDKILNRNDRKKFLYFTATHAHSSLGGWNNSIFGNLILGNYHEQWLDSLAQKVTLAIDFAATHGQAASLNYFEQDASEYVENRIEPKQGQIDGKLRGLKIIREDGSKGLLVSYSAHPTNISHLSLALSGDYPAALIANAEKEDFDFALFAAGNIGSHRAKWMPEKEFAMCDTLGSKLYRKVKLANSLRLTDSTISTAIIPVDYGPSQLHLLQQYKVRDWVFRALFTQLKGDITYLKIGNILFLGMPCDFSGEIFTRDGLGKLAERYGEELIATSFNGDYVGYITYDDHYGRSDEEEVMAMNWVGPHFGTYYSELVKKILYRSR